MHGKKQVLPAFGQQGRRGLDRPAVHGPRQRAQMGVLLAAPFARLEMILIALFVVRGQLAVEIQRRELRVFVAGHARSPSAERSLRVARNKQLRAASSDVPVISPICLRRIPW